MSASVTRLVKPASLYGPTTRQLKQGLGLLPQLEVPDGKKKNEEIHKRLARLAPRRLAVLVALCPQLLQQLVRQAHSCGCWVVAVSNIAAPATECQQLR